MKIAVMGAGAVGCYYGGMLRRAGHEVVLIARPQHVAAIERQGLRMQMRDFDGYVDVAASTQPEAVQGASLVLFSVKSYDTEAAGRQIAPHLAPGALVLSLQNGVDNADRLRAVIGHDVLATVVYVACGMAGPGHVQHHGRGELVLEQGPCAEQAAALLRQAQVPVQVSDNVRGALWAKLIVNCAYNALSAIGQVPYGALVRVPGVEAVMQALLAECRAVAGAEGVALPEGLDEAVQAIARTMPTQYSSTAQDLARGKASEIDHLNGLIVRKAQARGVPVPVNLTLHTLVKVIEARQASQAQPA
ncbi:2-dehydropantoate 2-reductase [Orrella sp. JC864]|uniref:ketopantoate reductase family protein n=1 Tax=Orrella sp. JC864 TaxID=3120298 RepID=UPI0012BB771E